MKKQTVWLLLIGSLCTGSIFFTRSLLNIPDGTADFMKGIGVALIVGALLLQRQSKKKDPTRRDRLPTGTPSTARVSPRDR